MDGDDVVVVVVVGGGAVVVVVIVNGSIVDVDIDIVLSAGKTRFSQVCFCLLWCRR